MSASNDRIRKAFDTVKGPTIFATVDEKGVPNIIYANCVKFFDDEHVIVADNYFDKTKKNLLHSGKRGSLLFMGADDTAYQIKGSLEYYADGKYFDHMKTWNPTRLPGHGAAVLRVEECYSGAEKIL
jgi:predicted pyridoxine 5'-phosphate oxidase superfamily flavin-nucleotide-binding protein